MKKRCIPQDADDGHGWDGAMVKDRLVYPFGGMWQQTAPFEEHVAGMGFRYVEAGLDPTPNRMYAYGMGRWLTPDPAGEKAVTLTNPQTWNMYAYAGNNPTTLTDATGLCAYSGPALAGCFALCDGILGGDSGPVAENYGSMGGLEADVDSGFVNAVRVDTGDQGRAQQQEEVAAEVYAEKTNGTADEYKAMASVIVNRANSGDKQYVDKGKAVNLENVLTHRDAFQARNSANAAAFRAGKVSKTALSNVRSAVTEVFKNGATTKATFFIANPGGAAPTARQVGALGSVIPASPANVGGVYLYILKPSGPGP